MTKVKVWLDDYYIYMEFTNEKGELVTHEQYGNVKPFNREYVENYLTYLIGECEVEYVD